MKKIQIIALSALLLTATLGIAHPAYAAQEGTQMEQQQKRPPRRPQLTMEEMQTVLSQKYFVTPEETKSLIDSGTSFRDLERAAKLSYISGKSVKDILALKKDEPWQRVEVLIGAVGEKAYQKELERKAVNLERWWGIPKKVGMRYMRQGYPMHYVKVTWILAKHSDWTMDAILKDKKYGENWKAGARGILVSMGRPMMHGSGSTRIRHTFPGSIFEYSFIRQ